MSESMMDHHIITTDARYWTTEGADATIIENQHPSECDDHSTIIVTAGLLRDSGEDMLGGGGMNKKSRRSQTEAERGMKAHPNALRPATTKAGKHRIRMKWSNDVNEFIMRTYYTITHLETQTKSYRDSLHKLFVQQYPDVVISQQRIADQRRAIVKNNLLPKTVLEAIREEVAMSLQMKTYTKTPSQQATTTSTIIKQELPATTTTHIVNNPMMTMKVPIIVHHQAQQSQQPQQLHLQQQQQPSTPIHIHTTSHLHQTPQQQQQQQQPQQRIHQAAALQNQPHIIIRVNSTPNGVLKHHFVDDGSTI